MEEEEGVRDRGKGKKKVESKILRITYSGQGK